jgi:hypothetical protein
MTIPEAIELSLSQKKAVVVNADSIDSVLDQVPSEWDVNWSDEEDGSFEVVGYAPDIVRFDGSVDAREWYLIVICK